MHYVAKLLDFALQPLMGVLLLIFWAWVASYRNLRAARTALGLAAALLLALGWQWLPEALLHPLERRYPEWPLDAPTEGFAGVIVLGGATSAAYLANDHAQPLLNEAAERMTAAVALHRQNPQLQVVFTGGEGSAFANGPSEAVRAQRFFATMGLPPGSMVLEGQSRNTFENSIFTAQTVGIDKNRPWLLLTSAWHMPRAMGVFQAQGWNVRAYPVDFRTASTTPWSSYSFPDSIALWQLALHEYAGILSYRLLGRM
jgi:uncharacterized SAM-binding protein YcdF (DUF218 family)